MYPSTALFPFSNGPVDTGPIAPGRTTHPVADLRRIEIKLGQRPAQRIAVHAKLIGRLTLVALMVRQHFQYVAFLELPDGFVIGHSSGVHLRYKNIELAFQGRPPPQPRLFMRSSNYIVPLPRLLDPIRCVVLQRNHALADMLLKVCRHDEGYRMRPVKEIA